MHWAGANNLIIIKAIFGLSWYCRDVVFKNMKTKVFLKKDINN